MQEISEYKDIEEVFGLEASQVEDVCISVAAAIDESGKCKRAADLLKRSDKTLYKWADPTVSVHAPLMAVIKMTVHAVHNLGKEPVFFIKWLETIGYRVVKIDGSDIPQDEISAAMDAINKDGKAISVLADAVKDGKIDQQEARALIPILQADNATTNSLIERLKQIATA